MRRVLAVPGAALPGAAGDVFAGGSIVAVRVISFRSFTTLRSAPCRSSRRNPGASICTNSPKVWGEGVFTLTPNSGFAGGDLTDVRSQRE